MKFLNGFTKILICISICCTFAGCSTPVQMPDENTPRIVLKQAQTRKLTAIGTVSVPAGIYEPDFVANDGIYYRAPTHIISHALGISQVMRGGIFVPNPPTPEEQIEIDKAKADDKAKAGKPIPNRGGNNPASSQEASHSVRDFQQGIWEDQQEGSGGLIGYAATSPKRIFHVTEPFVFEIQNTNTP